MPIGAQLIEDGTCPNGHPAKVYGVSDGHGQMVEGTPRCSDPNCPYSASNSGPASPSNPGKKTDDPSFLRSSR